MKTYQIYPIEIIKPEINNDEALSKIIKIMVKTPKIGEKRLDNLSELRGIVMLGQQKNLIKILNLKNIK